MRIVCAKVIDVRPLKVLNEKMGKRGGSISPVPVFSQ